MTKGGKRFRRTKASLDSSLLEGAEAVIKEVGFNNVTVARVLEKANVQASVFYNRYIDMNDLFDKLVREYDYWLNDSIRFDPVNTNTFQNFENLMFDLIDSLGKNKVMQELLVWELSSDNYITRRTAETRERNGKYLLDYLNDKVPDQGFNSGAFAALLIGGVYYLVLHRNVSTFCGVDFSKKEGIAQLKEVIRAIIKKMYDNVYVKPGIAEEMDPVNAGPKKRGRKKKIVDPLADTKSSIAFGDKNAAVSDAPKRKRGRPKKTIV